MGNSKATVCSEEFSSPSKISPHKENHISHSLSSFRAVAISFFKSFHPCFKLFEMTTPPQLLDSSQHNSTNEDVLLKQGEKYPTIDNDTSSVRTDSTTVPAANPPRRVTVSACHRRLCT
jgi:hypothetical protein